MLYTPSQLNFGEILENFGFFPEDFELYTPTPRPDFPKNMVVYDTSVDVLKILNLWNFWSFFLGNFGKSFLIFGKVRIMISKVRGKL